MPRIKRLIPGGLLLVLALGCQRPAPVPSYELQVFQSSAAGENYQMVNPEGENSGDSIVLFPEREYQRISGLGGAFTESSAYLIGQLSPEQQAVVMEAYFGDSGARYSLCRTHMNSCDFSLGSYSYAPVAGDTALVHFSLAEDEEDLIPLIQEAQRYSSEGFKLMASPWTAPPWMKDNQAWFGGKLLPQYRATWARFFSLYAQAYAEKGLPIWAFTVENEPLGNGAQWESMHFSAAETKDFVLQYLAPQLARDSIPAKLLVYDQNRGEELKHWADSLYSDSALHAAVYGTAIHWYRSSVDPLVESIDYLHQKAPDRAIIQTEGCVDAQVPVWADDAWYWEAKATDWGHRWSAPEKRHLHPPYVPVYRYARDIISCLNHQVEGWIDWNLVLDDKGGPNHAENWCVAPVLVKPELDSVYFTPLYYVMKHFSRHIRPGAQRIGWQSQSQKLELTAVKNPSGSLSLFILNPHDQALTYHLRVGAFERDLSIAPRALQSLVLEKPHN